LIFILGLFIFGCYGRYTPPILNGLAVNGFEQIDALRVYNKNNLFDYLDGEAEVYFPFGFRLLFLMQYEDVVNNTLMTVEVFDMEGTSGAQGIFQKYTQEGGSEIKDLGDSAWTDTYIVLFRRGSYFLRITPNYASARENNPELKDLIRLAGSVDSALIK
jgi:hypothetical protein